MSSGKNPSTDTPGEVGKAPIHQPRRARVPGRDEVHYGRGVRVEGGEGVSREAFRSGAVPPLVPRQAAPAPSGNVFKRFWEYHILGRGKPPDKRRNLRDVLVGALVILLGVIMLGMVVLLGLYDETRPFAAQVRSAWESMLGDSPAGARGGGVADRTGDPGVGAGTDATGDFVNRAWPIGGLMPGVGGLLLDSAESQVLGGDISGALESAETAMDVDPGDIRAALFLISQLDLRGEDDRVGELLDHVVANAAGHTDVVARFGGDLLMTGRYELASRVAGAVLDGLGSRIPDVRRAALLGVRGNALMLLGDSVSAERAYAEAIRLGDPPDPALLNNLAYLWADEGRRLELAEEYARRAVERMPVASHYDTLAVVLWKRGDVAGAREAIDTAASLPDGRSDPGILERQRVMRAGAGS